MPNRRTRPRFVGRRTVDQTPADYRAATRDMLAYNAAARRMRAVSKTRSRCDVTLDLIEALPARRRMTIADGAALVTADVLSRPPGARTPDR